MLFGTRHQKETVDCIIQNASGWKNTRNSTELGENTGLLDCSLSRRMRLDEASTQMRFQVRFWPSIPNVRQVFEDVAHQCWVGGEGLVGIECRDVGDIPRERKC